MSRASAVAGTRPNITLKLMRTFMLHSRSFRLGLLAALFCAAVAAPALASSGGSLPWEGPLEQIQESITGPVAGAIALAAMAIAGGMLIFGGEVDRKSTRPNPSH